jgi:anti-anti-sigma factor
MGKAAFSCRSFQRKGHSVVEIIGDVTFEVIDSLRHELAQLRVELPAKAVLDCTGVTLLSSVALGEFSRLIKWGLDNRCQLKVACQNDHVVDVLEIAGITDMIPLFPSLDMALNR